VHIPAPQADFAVLEPAPGSRVPLPRPGAAGGARAMPTPTPNLGGQSRPSALADTPFTVRYALPYPPASVLQGQTSTEAPNQCPNNNCTRKNLYVVRMFVFGGCSPTCPSAQTMCELQMADQTAPTGSATIDDRGYPLGYGFERCGPGPGEIDMSTSIVWNLPSTLFWNVHVEFEGVTKAPITWV
jgi:hypothetical protein